MRSLHTTSGSGNRITHDDALYQSRGQFAIGDCQIPGDGARALGKERNIDAAHPRAVLLLEMNVVEVDSHPHVARIRFGDASRVGGSFEGAAVPAAK